MPWWSWLFTGMIFSLGYEPARLLLWRWRAQVPAGKMAPVNNPGRGAAVQGKNIDLRGVGNSDYILADELTGKGKVSAIG